MTRLELSDKETTLLVDLLATSLSELSTEISHTDNRDFRQELKERENVMADLKKRLSSAL